MMMMMKFDENDFKYFPSGRMRVLAVDDNSTCLIFLEDLLRKCQYHVTSAKDATTALQILRENKEEFDLVITEVHLPDMDAFKLLEQVSNDIPVVLMSSDDEIERVMKGIRFGACDYLIKPVRIEEVKNIWQHVVRRKIINNNNNNNTDNNKCDDQSSGTGSSSVCKKRKGEENADHDDDHQPNIVVIEKEQEKEEEEEEKVLLPPKRKKPRVIWLSELHRKFIAAVDQVGVDKAVPKRILELMKVEGITRENVASHLQKYRMNLRKSKKEANHEQTNNSMLSSFESAAYYGQVDNSGQCVSYLPASCHRWGHSDNNNNNNNIIQFPTNSSSMMVHHTMNNQSHHEPTMPIETFVANDFLVNCDFANDNNNLMVNDQVDSSLTQDDYSSKLTNLDSYYHYHDHNSNSWPPTRVCYGQQGPNNFYLPITDNMNFGSTPSPGVLRQEFPRTPACLQVESRYDDDHMNGGVGGIVSMQLDDDGGSGERQQHGVCSLVESSSVHEHV